MLRAAAFLLVALALVPASACAPSAPACDEACMRRRPYEEACSRNDAEACYVAGGRENYERACLLGHVKGCYAALGGVSSVYSGNAAHMEPEDARRVDTFFGRACDLGDLEACARLGEIHVDRGEPAAARPRFERACDGADLKACVKLARLLARGRGGPADAGKALALVERACEAKDVGGCRLAAYYHYEGVGVAREGERALPRFEQACRLSDGLSCSVLALFQGEFHLGEGPFTIGELEELPNGAAVRFSGDVAPPPGALVTLHTSFSIGGAVTVSKSWSTAMRGHVQTAAHGRLVMDDDHSNNVRLAWGDGILVALTWPKPDPALDEAACSRTPYCKERGTCQAKGGYCTFGPAAGCAASLACQYGGQCAYDDAARACRPTEASCRASKDCAFSGSCTARDDHCVATAADCARATVCLESGNCGLAGDRCVATEAGCASSKSCRERHACKLVGDHCF